MKKIITIGISLNDNHKSRLSSIGELISFDEVDSLEDFLDKTQNADIIYSDGEYLLEALPELKDKFVTYPFVELGAFDSEKLAKNNVYVANSRGGNKNSVAEWTIYMILSLFRKFGPMIRTTKNIDFQLNESLEDKKVLIVGHGSIGKQIENLCKAFGMDVYFFDKDEDLIQKSKDMDLIINSLNCNSSTKNLLDERFFMNLKKGSYYVSFVRQYTYDLDGLIKSIDSNILAGAAIDCDPEDFGDTTNEFYQKALSNSKILVTPHIAFSTTQAGLNGREIAIQNIEKFINGNPQNIITKK